MRTIPHTEDELKGDEEDGSVAENDEDIFADVMTKRVDGRVRERAGDEIEGKVEVGESEEGEQEGNKLIQKFDVE